MENGRSHELCNGHLEILARLGKLGNPTPLNQLMCCDYGGLGDLKKMGLVLEKTEGNLTTYELSERGKAALGDARSNLACYLWQNIAL